MRTTAIIVQLEFWEKKRGLTLIVRAFYIFAYTKYWGDGFEAKPALYPTQYNQLYLPIL